ncbi:MAG: L-glutamate gamma-semialdehyde dehydrogenase [Coriobacteriia bacterium]|nr:L-glutamate gamma-semialdehyde dehydrogenase [Coriobacteriia bacterium]MCL2537528.1 L-glutamate gamma-semialdehyde dehydrogenase [Coriobacteriia bacterium]
MNNAIYNVPTPINEPVRNYAPGSPERASIKAELERMAAAEPMQIPYVIDGKEYFEGPKKQVVMPHDHAHVLADFTMAGIDELKDAVNSAMDAKESWAAMPWEHRAAIFLKAADLVAGPWRDRINASTMLGQSKTVYQAEIDAACELADFLRFNVFFAQEIYKNQPESAPTMWNRMEHRPLSGFVLAISPFNFTAIGGNLPTAPALMGNTVVWKPASTSVLSNYLVYQVLREAGLPDGVINFVPSRGADVDTAVIQDPRMAGFHFTGSTEVFSQVWRVIGDNIKMYENYPRMVGETGGKDFIFAHPTADVRSVVVAMVRGAFEYQGQKCSAASRCYIPESLWPAIKEDLLAEVAKLKVGDVRDFTNFMGAVIDEPAFKSITGYIDYAAASDEAEVLCGSYDGSKGYFVEPTVIQTTNPNFKTMVEEIFGPVLTVYVYPDAQLEETLISCRDASVYALTGAIFAQDRAALMQMDTALADAAGNFYINDKPTGAVVGQQPFGGGRASGTNNKAGSTLNLLCWTSPRTVKETFVPAQQVEYPFMDEA